MQVTTRGDCSVIQIPSGIEAMLYGGTEVTILQIHSTYFTVKINQYGFMVRVDGEDAHVLCEEAIHKRRGVAGIDHAVAVQIHERGGASVGEQLAERGRVTHIDDARPES